MFVTAASLFVGCGGNDSGGVIPLPPRPQPEQPKPGEDVTEYPLISTEPAFITEAMTLMSL